MTKVKFKKGDIINEIRYSPDFCAVSSYSASEDISEDKWDSLENLDDKEDTHRRLLKLLADGQITQKDMHTVHTITTCIDAPL